MDDQDKSKSQHKRHHRRRSKSRDNEQATSLTLPISPTQPKSCRYTEEELLTAKIIQPREYCLVGKVKSARPPPMSKEKTLKEMGFNATDTVDWENIVQPTKTCLYKLLRKMFTKNVKTNLEVRIGEALFKCHMIVLQCYSKFFMECDNEVVIDLPEEKVTARAFEMLYQWMITDYPLIQREGILELIVAADFLKVEELINQCWVCLDDCERFGEDKAFLLYWESRKFGFECLKSLMLNRITKFFLTLVASKEFLMLRVDEICMLLTSSLLGVNSEIEVFLCAVRWIDYDWTERERFLVEVMEHIRFSQMPVCYLVTLSSRAHPEPEIARIVSNERVFQLICDGIAYCTTKLCYGGDHEELKRLEKQSHFKKWVERLWIYDPECSYHHQHLGCLQLQKITYNAFLEYLQMRQNAGNRNWQNLESLKKVIPITKECCKMAESRQRADEAIKSSGCDQAIQVESRSPNSMDHSNSTILTDRSQQYSQHLPWIMFDTQQHQKVIQSQIVLDRQETKIQQAQQQHERFTRPLHSGIGTEKFVLDKDCQPSEGIVIGEDTKLSQFQSSIGVNSLQHQQGQQPPSQQVQEEPQFFEPELKNQKPQKLSRKHKEPEQRPISPQPIHQQTEAQPIEATQQQVNPQQASQSTFMKCIELAQPRKYLQSFAMPMFGTQHQQAVLQAQVVHDKLEMKMQQKEPQKKELQREPPQCFEPEPMQRKQAKLTREPKETEQRHVSPRPTCQLTDMQPSEVPCQSTFTQRIEIAQPRKYIQPMAMPMTNIKVQETTTMATRECVFIERQQQQQTQPPAAATTEQSQYQRPQQHKQQKTYIEKTIYTKATKATKAITSHHQNRVEQQESVRSSTTTTETTTETSSMSSLQLHFTEKQRPRHDCQESDDNPLLASSNTVSRESRSPPKKPKCCQRDTSITAGQFNSLCYRKLLILGGIDPYCPSKMDVTGVQSGTNLLPCCNHENFGDHVLFYESSLTEWTHLSYLPFGSRHHHAVVQCNGIIYMIGGTRSNYGCSKKAVFEKSVWAFNPQTLQWTLECCLPELRRDFAAIAIENNCERCLSPNEHHNASIGFYVIGGEGLNQTILNTVWFYDIIRKKWRRKPSLNVGRYGFTAAIVKNEIWVAGGIVDATASNTTTEENSKNDSSNYNNDDDDDADNNASGSSVGVGGGISFGALDSGCKTIDMNVEIITDTIERYSLKCLRKQCGAHGDTAVSVCEYCLGEGGGCWIKAKERLRVPRLFSSLCKLSEDELYLVGGIGPTSEGYLASMCSIDRYDFVQRTWFYYGNIEQARHGHAVIGSHQRLIVVGGVSTLLDKTLDKVEVFCTHKSQVEEDNALPDLPFPISGCCLALVD